MEVGCKSGRPSLLEIQVSSVFLILVRTLEMPPYHLINVHFVGVSQTDLHFASTSKVITFILEVHFKSGGLAKRTLSVFTPTFTSFTFGSIRDEWLCR